MGRRMPPAVAAPEAPAASNPLREIRWLIWLYFALLLFEGALRKWGVPSLANPLLIVRDPVLLLIYAIAFMRRVFPVNAFVITIGFLGTLCLLATFLAEYGDWRVAIFGFRCNFLHLPLIFIIARAFNFRDVRRIGWCMLAFSMPMAALMALQFNSPADAWINRGAGEDASMIASIDGRIRPSGTFSFVSGIIYFYALTMVFLVYGLVQKRMFPWWLTLTAGLALPVALAVSSSRSTVGACAIVLVAFAFAVVCRPSLALMATKLVVIGFIIASSVGGLALFQQGMEIFEARVEHASDVEGGVEGFAHRALGQFIRPFALVLNVPIMGYGLGSGTNVGAKMLTGHLDFLLAEEEWERVICESGPALGLSFIFLRVGMGIWLFWLAWRATRAGHFLPMLLVGASGLPIINGQFGQTTTLGFAVFLAGITLASMRVPEAAVAAARLKVRRMQLLPEKVRATRAAVAARREAARGRPPQIIAPPAPL
jgi:hypothetical protein